MAVLDSESLFRPISDAEPAGPNLEYDGDVAALDRALAGKPEQQIGSVLIPAEGPDWNEVQRLAVDLLGRTKDLRIGCPLVRAIAAKNGLEGLSEGLGLLSVLLERFWDSIHPQLDPDDDNDPTIRVNSLTALGDPESIREFRAAPLFRSRAFGPVSARDCVAAAGQTNGENAQIDSAALEAAFQEVDIETLGRIVEAGDHALEHVKAIERTFEAHVGDRGPDLSRLTQSIEQTLKFIRPRFEARRSENGAEAAAPLPGAPGVDGMAARGAPAGPALTGEVRSRDDVVRALDKICEYYRRHEPSSPIPLLIERCKRLASMDFLDIVRELAPEGLPQAEAMTGVKRES